MGYCIRYCQCISIIVNGLLYQILPVLYLNHCEWVTVSDTASVISIIQNGLQYQILPVLYLNHCEWATVSDTASVVSQSL